MAYKRQVIILKGIDTNRENIPFGYILMEVLGNKLDLQIMFQMADINDDDNFYLIGVIKQREEFVPVKFISIKIKNKSVSQSFSTNAYNLFNSGIQIKDIFGFGIIKIKDKKQRLLLIGAFSDECLFQMERDIIKRLEMDHKNEKNGNKQIANKDSVQIKQIGFITNKEDAKDNEENDLNKVDIMKEESLNEIHSKPLLHEIEQKEDIQDNTQENTADEIIEDKYEEDYDEKYNILEYGDKKVWLKIFDDIKNIGEKCKPFSDDKVRWVKIDKKDIYRVSHCHPFLHLLSNPFVIKFVNRYGYIIVGFRKGKQKNKIELLVPGEFSEEYYQRGKVFGFSDFITKDGRIFEGKEGYWKMAIELIEGE